MITAACVCVGGCATPHADGGRDVPGAARGQGPAVVRFEDVRWTPLNPARGDESPGAGALWGDRTGPGPAGFLVRFSEGFSSPPHIHNVSYRGVVISGRIHNDDPGAAPMWMEQGSFWTQPRGEAHITAADGRANIAYVEIDDGPYLVRPVGGAFESGEQPINVDASNLVWLDATDPVAHAKRRAEASPMVAYLWGSRREGSRSGALLRVPPGAAVDLRSSGETLRAVVVSGSVRIGPGDGAGEAALEPGSYIGLTRGSVSRIDSDGSGGSVVYLRADGMYDIIAVRDR